eukprot:scaffold162147_cov25-Tisochrysis_lutea.AAC.2
MGVCTGEAENLLIMMAEGCRQAGKNNIKSGGSAVTARKLGKSGSSLESLCCVVRACPDTSHPRMLACLVQEFGWIAAAKRHGQLRLAISLQHGRLMLAVSSPWSHASTKPGRLGFTLVLRISHSSFLHA